MPLRRCSGLLGRRWLAPLLIGTLALGSAAAAQAPLVANADPLTGPRSRLSKNWLGQAPLPADTPILVLAGHADSQGIGGAGTAGAAVDLAGAPPMQPGIRDELHWNLLTAQAVVALGQQRGLNIRFYDPPLRTIADGDDPRTNWSIGKAHAAAGGYALEIHYDAYGPDGVGSGLIPPLHRPPSRLDESLAQAFGPYPLHFRDGLGAPRRGIAILEIGKLEGSLEAALRDPRRSEGALAAIAERVVQALERGLGRDGGQPPAPAPVALSSPPDGERSAPPVRRRPTRPGAW
jgi:hypothetical protein